jgi:ribosomal-protein-alanine N-acetyltransferase
MSEPEIKTPRLYLPLLSEVMLDDFKQLVSDPDIMRFIGEPQSNEQAHSMFLNYLEYRPKYGLGSWALIEKETKEFIGYGILRFLWDTRSAEIGYVLSKKYWGKGLAVEAARAILRWGFERSDVSSIAGLADPQNLASIRVLEKLGMQYTGIVHDENKDWKCYTVHRNLFLKTFEAPRPLSRAQILSKKKPTHQNTGVGLKFSSAR